MFEERDELLILKTKKCCFYSTKFSIFKEELFYISLLYIAYRLSSLNVLLIEK